MLHIANSITVKTHGSSWASGSSASAQRPDAHPSARARIRRDPAGGKLFVCFFPFAGLRRTIESMGTSPWWFTPLMTFTGAVFGGAVSIVTTWLTQRYGLKAQLIVKRADAEANATEALRSEKEKRYLAIVRNLESLYVKAQNPAAKSEFLTTVRELWLLGDQELVRKLRLFLVDIAGKKDVDARERLFGDVILDMRKGLGLPTDQLSNEDFRFHSV